MFVDDSVNMRGLHARCPDGAIEIRIERNSVLEFVRLKFRPSVRGVVRIRNLFGCNGLPRE